MPEISRPCSNRKVKVCIYADDEDPPHFHVRGPNISAKVAIRTLEVTRGAVPKRELDEIRAWARANTQALLEKWTELNERE
jgi:hypothetical protein